MCFKPLGTIEIKLSLFFWKKNLSKWSGDMISQSSEHRPSLRHPSNPSDDGERNRWREEDKNKRKKTHSWMPIKWAWGFFFIVEYYDCERMKQGRIQFNLSVLGHSHAMARNHIADVVHSRLWSAHRGLRSEQQGNQRIWIEIYTFIIPSFISKLIQ